MTLQWLLIFFFFCSLLVLPVGEIKMYNTLRCTAMSDSSATPSEHTATSTAALVMFESPRFIEEPARIYYVLRTRPVTVSCRATSAMQVNFKCIGQWVPPSQHVTTEGVERQAPFRKYVQVNRLLSPVVIITDYYQKFTERRFSRFLCFLLFC